MKPQQSDKPVTVTNRQARRRAVAALRREVAGGLLLTYLVAADARLDQPLLSKARAHWFAQIEVRKPCCISCRVSFARNEAQPAAILLATPAFAATACSVSALCGDCWGKLPPDEVDHVCARVLRRLMPGAQFLGPADAAR